MEYTVSFGLGENRTVKTVVASSPQNAADKVTGYRHTANIHPLAMHENAWVGRFRNALDVIIVKVD